MTKYHSTANTADFKNTPYQYPVIASSSLLHINEDDEALPWALKQAELKALRKTASGQIARLYQLANLIIKDELIGRSQDDLKQIAEEIRNATNTLEATLHAIVGPRVNDPEPGQEEIAD